VDEEGQTGVGVEKQVLAPPADPGDPRAAKPEKPDAWSEKVEKELNETDTTKR